MKRGAAVAAALLIVAFAAAAAVQTVRLGTAQQKLDALEAETGDLRSELDAVKAQLAEEQSAREEAENKLNDLEQQQALESAAQAKANIQEGDEIGRVWVDGTELDCTMYWGDSGSQFRNGAGVHSADGCVLPGENGTVFVGGHTDSWFLDLKSAEIGSIIHLETPWGNFSYQITETKVIQETEIDQCRWGEQAPSCILYTCYPFGIQTPTDQRYLVYADPLETDENGVVPDELRQGEE